MFTFTSESDLEIPLNPNLSSAELCEQEYVDPGLRSAFKFYCERARLFDARGEGDLAFEWAESVMDSLEHRSCNAAETIEAVELRREIGNRYRGEPADYGGYISQQYHVRYIHALMQFPDMDTEKVKREIEYMRKHADQSYQFGLREYWGTKFWFHHFTGDEDKAREACEAWKETLRDEDPQCYETLAYEILMLTTIREYDLAITCAKHVSVEESSSPYFRNALLEAYVHTQRLDDAVEAALNLVTDSPLPKWFYQYSSLTRVVNSLPQDVVKYIRFAAFLLDQLGFVPEEQREDVVALYSEGEPLAPLPKLTPETGLSYRALAYHEGFWALSQSEVDVTMCRKLIRRLAAITNSCCGFGYDCPAWVLLAASLTRKSQGEARSFWLEQTLWFSKLMPQVAVDLARSCAEQAVADEDFGVLWSAGELVKIREELVWFPQIYAECAGWIRQASALEQKQHPDRKSVIVARECLELGKLASIADKWQEAREYLFRSLHLHISPEWIEDLEELLRINPLVERPEPEPIQITWGKANGYGFDAAYRVFRWAQAKMHTEIQVLALQEMFRDTERLSFHFETISIFREWITLCSDYRGLKLWDLLEDHFLRYCLWYIWALCENPTTTAQDVEEAMTHVESVLLLADNAENSEMLAIARILFAYRFGDLATAEKQRLMRCHQKSTDGILLHDVESIYCIDAYTAVGDYEAVVAGIRESWGKRKIPRFLQAALLEAYLVTGREKRAAKWYEKLWDFSVARALHKRSWRRALQEEIAGECGILRYLLRLVERGEGGYRRDLRKRVLGVVSVWDKLFYPREMGKLAGVLAVAIRVGFDSDEVFPAVLSASGCEWVSVPDVDHPTGREAATWFEQIACQVEELFRPEKPIRVPQAGIYVSDWDVVREFFQEYFDAKTFGFYENPEANFRSNYLYFDYGEHQTLGYFNWSRFAIMQLPVPPNAEKAVTIEVNHRSRAEGIIARLRADGYPVLTELTQTDAGSYVAEVQGADNIHITITARQ